MWPVSNVMKEMAKEMPFTFGLYDHLHDGRFGKLKWVKMIKLSDRINFNSVNIRNLSYILFTSLDLFYEL